MHDQADDLRQLVRTTTLRQNQRAHSPSPLIAFAGGKGGVGTTTIAVNYAIASALAGHRIVLVDAATSRADCATRCQVESTHDVGDVLAGRLSVHEVLVRGPAGIQIVPGRWAATHEDDSPHAQDRLISQLRELGAHADRVILDIGASFHSVTRRHWRAADAVVVVTSPEHSAVMETYAAIKLMHDRAASVPTGIFVNRADPDTANDAHGRIVRAAKRFLATELHYFGRLADDDAVAAATEHNAPFITSEGSSAAKDIIACAEASEDWLRQAFSDASSRTSASDLRSDSPHTTPKRKSPSVHHAA